MTSVRFVTFFRSTVPNRRPGPSVHIVLRLSPGSILRELDDAKSAVRWLLDVTGTALNSLLISWARGHERCELSATNPAP